MPGILMSGRTGSEGSILPEPIQCLRPRSGVMQDIRALAGLSTKPLPKKLRHAIEEIGRWVE